MSLINNNSKADVEFQNDLFDFNRVHLHLKDCPDSTYLEIRENHQFLHHKKSKDRDESGKKYTIERVIKLVKDWELFHQLDNDSKYEIDNTFRESEVQAKDIRNIYRSVIEKSLEESINISKKNSKSEEPFCDSFAKSTIGKNHYQRIVYDDKKEVVAEDSSFLFRRLGNNNLTLLIVAILNLFRPAVRKINNETVAKFYQTLKNEWGESRVKRILATHNINFESNYGRALRVQHVRKIYSSLNLIRSEDLEETFEFIKNYLNGDTKKIPTRLLNKIEQNKEQIRDLFLDEFNEYKDLLPVQKKAILKLIAPTKEEIELNLLGERIEQVIHGYYDFGSIYRLYHSEYHENKQWTQTDQATLGSQNHPNSMLDFAEKWGKIYAKKGGSRFVDDLVGRIVPGPDGEWYKIAKTTEGWGKFTFFLEPVIDSKKPALIVHRSTAAATYSISTTFTSLLQITNPFRPPGYLHTDFKEEMEFIKNHENIIITGHSLGGSFAELNFARFVEGLKENEVCKKEIKVITFDAPGIRLKDVETVSKGKEQLPNAKIIHRFSEGDIVPHSGNAHIAFEKEGELVDTDAAFLTSEDKNSPEVNGIRHSNYWYFLQQKMKNIIQKKPIDAKELKQFGKWWVRSGRVALGIVPFFALYPLVFIQENIRLATGFNIFSPLSWLSRKIAMPIVPVIHTESNDNKKENE
jgi:hypothetical protein